MSLRKLQLLINVIVIAIVIVIETTTSLIYLLSHQISAALFPYDPRSPLLQTSSDVVLLQFDDGKNIVVAFLHCQPRHVATTFPFADINCETCSNKTILHLGMPKRSL
jgi:hypothetical protein